MGLSRHLRKKVELNDMKQSDEIEARLKERYAKGEITEEQYENMKKQLVIIGIVAILVSVGFSGCNEENNMLTPEKSKFVGTWTNSTSMVIDLFSDGSCTYLSINGTWDLKDGILGFELSSGSIIHYRYKFSNNNRTLTLTNVIHGTTFDLTKQ